MASLHGLPPLPKSLSALLNFSSSQWKEMERMHAMRTAIQQDLSRCSTSVTTPSVAGGKKTTDEDRQEDDGSGFASQDHQGPSRSRLDAQLALLRKEMVLLRQCDMSLLCQLWSLNESIQEYKHILHDGNSYSWEDSYSNPDEHHRSPFKMRHKDLSSVPEHLSSPSSRTTSPSSNSSHSSFEFGDV